MTLRILHLVGSAVSDFHAELSRLYAAASLAALGDHARYEFRVAYISPDGSWRFPADLTAAEIEAAAPMDLAYALRHLRDVAPQVMVPQMFCLPGMTAYRSLFDVLGIPYVGNPGEVMALAADKAKARAVVAAAGVDVPRGEVLRTGQRPSLAPPTVVKPVDADNSLGTTLVRDVEEYGDALRAAWDHSDRALVEAYVELGREVRCGIVIRGDELECLRLEEYRVDPVDKPIRGRADKLDRTDAGELRLVAKDAEHAWIVDPDDPITAVVWEAARACYLALGCRDYGLFDFRVDPDGRPWFLEAGLYNSFSPSSVVAVMAQATGIELSELFAEALTQALARSPVTLADVSTSTPTSPHTSGVS